MSSHQQNAPTFLFHHHHAFCSEDDECCGEIIDPIKFTSKIFTDFSFDSDGDEQLGMLLNREKMMVAENEIMDYNGLEKINNPFMAECRNDAVEWILKVIDYYSFSALTALLAVNFLDRFLCKSESHGENKSWMIHLAAVACLSLAAKVEETQVPLLLDLQVEECKYVFESKTIQRMELLVLSTLEWKMSPVTPISFLDFITKRLCLETHLCEEFIMRYECILLSLITDCRYMCHLPSALATATMVSVISSAEPCIGMDCHAQLIGILGIINNKDKVEDCLRLIQQVQSSSNKRRWFNGTLFYSPKGVIIMDNISSNLSSDSSSSSSSTESSCSSVSSVVNSSSPEHLSKRIKSNNSIS